MIKYFYVYILTCDDGSYYVGHTDDLELRITQHMRGKVSSYTSKRLPIKLVFAETFATRDEAFYAERKIKKWGRRKKEALIARKWDIISLLASRKKNKEELLAGM